MKIQRLLLAAVILAASVVIAPIHRPAHAQEETISEGCQFVNTMKTAGEFVFIIPNLPFNEGEVITVSAQSEGPGEGFSFIFYVFKNPVGVSAVPGSISYTIPADGRYIMGIFPGSEYLLIWTISCTPATGAPGCDTLIPLDHAVVGLFVSDAPAYWTPGQLTNPPITIPAGKTLYVFGQDETEHYDKVLLGCTFLWVPKEAVAPNPDAVWRSAPLPTLIVK